MVYKGTIHWPFTSSLRIHSSRVKVNPFRQLSLRPAKTGHSVFDNTHSGSAIANDCVIHCVGEYLFSLRTVQPQHEILVDGLPFGGTGASGCKYILRRSGIKYSDCLVPDGSSTGKYSFDTFTHLRSTMDNPGWWTQPIIFHSPHTSDYWLYNRTDVIMKMRFPPYTEAKARTLKANLYSGPPKTKRSGWGRIVLMTAIVAVLSAYLKNKGTLVNLASDVRSLIGLWVRLLYIARGVW